MKKWMGAFLTLVIVWYPVSVGASTSGEDYSKVLWNSESAARWEVGMSVPQAEAWYDILTDGAMFLGAVGGFATLTAPVVGQVAGVLVGWTSLEAMRLKRCTKNFSRGAIITGYSWRIADWQWQDGKPVEADRWYSVILSCRPQEVA